MNRVADFQFNPFIFKLHKHSFSDTVYTSVCVYSDNRNPY